MMVIIIAGLWMAVRPQLSPQPEAHNWQKAASTKTKPDLPNAPPSAGQDRITAENKYYNQSSIIKTQSKPQDFTVEEQPQIFKNPKIYIVHQGDTLSAIAGRYYGSTNQWQKIFVANRSRIKDANRLKPGTQLIIPD